MKCEDCSHAEMCKWIDELEGRGCDFGKPCDLLIIKSDILLHQDDRKKWMDSIKREKENGVIILPPYFTPLLVPNDVEIRIEQPCDDAISREAVLNLFKEHCGELLNYALVWEEVEHLPSVTPSRRKGHWIKTNSGYECSECALESRSKSDFCQYCGTEMVEPQESEDKE